MNTRPPYLTLTLKQSIPMVKGLLLTLSLLFLAPAFASSNNQAWHFKVFLDDKEIGEHNFILTNKEEGTHISIFAKFDVKFLFFSAYEYLHKNHEIWNGSCLKSINSTTDDNGEKLHVSGTDANGTFQITTQSGQSNADGCIKTFAYWDPIILKATKLLNAQTGELLDVEVKNLGQEEITVHEQPTPANHYQLITKDFTIDLWYSKQNEWLALNSTTSEGYTLRYTIK